MKKGIKKIDGILMEIVNYKIDFVEDLMQKEPLSYLANSIKETNRLKNVFTSKIKELHHLKKPAIIAEIKKASPSQGVIDENFDPVGISKDYVSGGAACISILTDEKFFLGKIEDLISVRRTTDIPILQKDFIVDEYQLYKARSVGADCILLIMKYLDPLYAAELESISFSLGLDVLCECHDSLEIETAQKHLTTKLIGINNRNLANFSIDINNTKNLCDFASQNGSRIVVCESGIDSKKQIDDLRHFGCNTFLIGTSIMKSKDRLSKLKELMS
jgi:indole-3-glycerol phosphate synthase